jgi:hypothetical protein
MHKKLLGTIAATMLALASPSLAEYDPPAGAVRANYEALARTPEKYKGQNIVVHGTVTQTIEDDGDFVALEVSITTKEFSRAERVVVGYERGNPSEPRILAGDIIDFWGQYRGLFTGETILQNNVKLPAIHAVQIRQSPQPGK